MKNELPIMPIRAMYADKTPDGRDISSLGKNDPVVITENSTYDDLKKAVEAGAVKIDDTVYYLVSSEINESSINAYFTCLPIDDGVLTCYNIYADVGEPIGKDSYIWKSISYYENVQPQLYRHNLYIVVGGSKPCMIYCTLVGTSNEAITTLDALSNVITFNTFVSATGSRYTNSVGYSVVAIAVSNPFALLVKYRDGGALPTDTVNIIGDITITDNVARIDR